MTTPPSTSEVEFGFYSKLRFYGACALAAALMYYVAWPTVQPADPDAAVAPVVHGANPATAALSAIPILLLTAVTAALCTSLVGRSLPDGGLFAAGVGLAAVALRGGSMQVLLGYHVEVYPAVEGVKELALLIDHRRAVMRWLAFDTLIWTAVMFAAWATTVAVRKWVWSPQGEQTSADEPSAAVKAKAAAQVPPWGGWGAIILTVAVACVVIWATIGRTPYSTILRGQVVACVFLGLFAGAAAARYFIGTEDVRWYLPAAAIVALTACLMGYTGAAMKDDVFANYRYLATTPPHALVRALPIEYLAIGVPGTLAGYWFGRRVEEAAEQGAI